MVTTSAGIDSFWNVSIFGIHMAIKIFGIPQPRVPATFSQQSCAVFRIHNFGLWFPDFGIHQSKLRNSEGILLVQLGPWTSDPRIQCIQVKTFGTRTVGFMVHALQREKEPKHLFGGFGVSSMHLRISMLQGPNH